MSGSHEVTGHICAAARSIACAALAASVLAGCSGLKPYADSPEKNLHIRTHTASGSAFSSVRASVDVYRVERGCVAEYEGTVALDNADMTMGVPANRTSYLVFRFASSAFLGSSSSTISYEALVNPRPGSSYDVRVRYVDNIYNVAIRDDAGHEIERQRLPGCRSS